MNHTEAAQYIKATLTAFGPGEAISMTKETWAKIHEAMQALAQPEQEPVAWIEHHKAGDNLVWDEPSKGTPLYTTPPQRKPLTENEIKHLWYEACQTNLELTSQLIVHLARNIEAAHGIKE